MKLFKWICPLVLCAAMLAPQAMAADYTYDHWGDSIPAPVSYALTNMVTGQSTGTVPFDAPKDIFVGRDAIYVADSGNNRIVVLDLSYRFLYEITTVTGCEDGIETLNEPAGIFVDNEGVIYICDTANERVLKVDKTGKCLLTLKKPENDLLDEHLRFTPVKVVASGIGDIFVVAEGIYMGFVRYNAKGDFLGFFGTNRVEVTADVLARSLWKKFFTEEQNQASVQFLPIEYSNAFIDSDGMIYAVVKRSTTSLDEVKKLNAKGQNVLRFVNEGKLYPQNDFGDVEKEYVRGVLQDNWFVSVDVTDDGLMVLLDANKGHVFVYNANSELMFVFGSRGIGNAVFSNPADVAHNGSDLLIVDSDAGDIKIFSPTIYTQKVIEALSFDSEHYEQAAAVWQQVLKYNSNSALAYRGLGKARMQQGDYTGAMAYFKLANAKRDYSDVFRAYRKQQLEKYAVFLVIGAVALIVALRFALRLFKKWLGYSVTARKVRFK